MPYEAKKYITNRTLNDLLSLHSSKPKFSLKATENI